MGRLSEASRSIAKKLKLKKGEFERAAKILSKKYIHF